MFFVEKSKKYFKNLHNLKKRPGYAPGRALMMAEEMPEAYKNVSQVVDAVAGAGISKIVARLKPLGVIKG